MNKARFSCVNFGSAKGGLSTVGYAMYGEDGQVSSSRTTSGVIEIGTSTGIYAANIGLNDTFNGLVLWDTGEATPRYGIEPLFGQLNAIQEETDTIRLIRNSMRNQGEVLTRIVELAREINKSKSKSSEYSKEFKELFVLLGDIGKKKYPGIPEITTAFKSIPAPEIKVPDYSGSFSELKTILASIPNYTKQLSDFNIKLSGILNEVKVIPKQHKDYTNDLLSMTQRFSSMLNVLETKLNSAAKSDDVSRTATNLNATIEKIRQEIEKTRAQLEQSIIDNTKLDKVVKDMITYQKLSKVVDNLEAQSKSADALRFALGLKR